MQLGDAVHHVEPKVMDVLVFLAQHPGQVVEREAIIEAVWGGRFVSDDPLSKCIAELRKVLGDTARDSKFIGTVHKRGYRLLQPVTPIKTDNAPAGAGSQRSSIVRLLAAVAVVAVIVVTWQLRHPTETQSQPPAAEASIARHTLAVLPLAIRSTNADDAFIGDGLHDDLLTQLARNKDWDVISRTSVERFRHTDEEMAAIAQSLNATLILEGGLQRSGDKVRINLQLIEPSADSHLWARTYDRDVSEDNLFSMQRELVQDVVSEVARVLDVSAPSAKTPSTLNFAAYSEFVKGRRLVRSESVTSLRDAVEHFKAAIEVEPNYAEAHAALADTYLSLATYFFGGMSKAEAVAAAEPLIERAIELDPELAQAYVANAMLSSLQIDATTAEESLERALRLQPSYPRAYRIFASLRWSQLRRDEAIDLAQYASSLDPFSGVIQLELGRYYEATAQFDQALKNYLIAENLLPDNALVRLYIGALKFLVLGDVADSLNWYLRASELDPESPSMQVTPAFAYIEIGDLERARHHVDLGRALDPDLPWVRLASMQLNQRSGDQEAAVLDAATILAASPKQWGALRQLRDDDLEAGRVDAALQRYAEQFPELTEQEEPRIHSLNYVIAVDLALVYEAQGRSDKAMRMTAGALDVMDSMHRLGLMGYSLTDIGALAIRGEHDEALDRLDEIVDSGYRYKLWYYFDVEQNMESLRSLPRFQVIRDKAFAGVEAEAEKAALLVR